MIVPYVPALGKQFTFTSSSYWPWESEAVTHIVHTDTESQGA